MYKMKILSTLLFLIPALALSQVGINTTSPTATFHVNGNVKLKASNGLPTDSILVIRNEEVLKIPASALSAPQSVCPSFKHSQSSGYNLVFTSTASIPYPNNPLNIQGKNFVNSEASIYGNLYHYKFSNTTGQPININTFTVNFSGLICNY